MSTAGVREIQVWRGRFGDPTPLIGPLPGLRDGDTLAYELQLPERFTPRPGHDRLERTYVLLDLGVSFLLPTWAQLDTPDAGVVDGIDPDLAVSSTWYVDLVHVDETPRGFVVRDLYIDVMVPVDGRHQRLLDLDEFADAIEDGTLPVPDAIDALRRWQQFLDRHLHAPRDPIADWTDFPPKRIEQLAAVPAPIGPPVTVP